MLTVILVGHAIGVRSALRPTNIRSHASGVWGHAAPENFEIYYPLKSVFLQYEQQFILKKLILYSKSF